MQMSKHTTLDQLRLLALRTKSEIGKVDTKVSELTTKVDSLVETGGEPNVLTGVKVNGTALSIAEKMVDILIAEGATNGTLAVNGTDVAVKGLAALAYKAKVSQSDLESALSDVINANKSKLETLIGSTEGDDAKSVRAISAEEVSKIVAGADASYDTLKEIADWISSHADSASSMNSQINTNKTDIANLAKLVGTLPDGAVSTTVVGYIAEAIAALSIGDYAKTTEVTAAISTALASYYTKTEADSTFLKKADLVMATDAEVTAMLTEVFGAET